MNIDKKFREMAAFNRRQSKFRRRQLLLRRPWKFAVEALGLNWKVRRFVENRVPMWHVVATTNNEFPTLEWGTYDQVLREQPAGLDVVGSFWTRWAANRFADRLKPLK